MHCNKIKYYIFEDIKMTGKLRKDWSGRANWKKNQIKFYGSEAWDIEHGEVPGPNLTLKQNPNCGISSRQGKEWAKELKERSEDTIWNVHGAEEGDTEEAEKANKMEQET